MEYGFAKQWSAKLNRDRLQLKTIIGYGLFQYGVGKLSKTHIDNPLSAFQVSTNTVCIIITCHEYDVIGD